MTEHFQYQGVNWIRPDELTCSLRVVVGQRATLKADHTLIADAKRFAMAA